MDLNQSNLHWTLLNGKFTEEDNSVRDLWQLLAKNILVYFRNMKIAELLVLIPALKDFPDVNHLNYKA